MKKNYVKPVVVIDDFTLCANIAAGCVFKANHFKDVCALHDGDWKIFTSSIPACEDVQWDQDGEKICYHNPYDTNNVFSS